VVRSAARWDTCAGAQRGARRQARGETTAVAPDPQAGWPIRESSPGRPAPTSRAPARPRTWPLPSAGWA